MSEITTKPIPLFSPSDAEPASSRLRQIARSLDLPAADPAVFRRSPPTALSDLGAEHILRGNPLAALPELCARAVFLLLESMQALAEGESSRPLTGGEFLRASLPALPPGASFKNGGPAESVYPEADFFEPTEFSWSEAEYAAGRALKEFSK